MPEGHKLHRLARDHGRLLKGRTLRVRSPQGRFAAEAERLDGRRLDDVFARGKHLFYRLDGEDAWHVHLGLYGKFRPFKGDEPEPRGQVRAAVASDAGGFHLVGPNQCELLGEAAVEALLARLGPDPLVKSDTADRMVEKVGRSRVAIGALLLDQSVVAGVGNIYRADVLFLEGVHPATPGRDVPEERVRSMWDRLRAMMKLGVKYDRIITADPADFGKSPGRLTADERLLIYKAPRCPRCGTETETLQIAARRIDACPRCQPRG